MIFMLFIAALPMSYLAATGGVRGAETARSDPSQPILTPNVKSHHPTNPPQIIKGPLSCCFAPFPALCLITECGASRASNQPRKGARGREDHGGERKKKKRNNNPKKKKKNLIQNTAKKK